MKIEPTRPGPNLWHQRPGCLRMKLEPGKQQLLAICPYLL